MKKKKENDESFCENPFGAHFDSKKVKTKGVSSSETLSKVLEDEDFPLHPFHDYKLEQ